MLVTREFTFDAAHYLTNYYGKCERMHGHTYKLQVTLEGKVQSNGLVIDFVVLKRIVKKHVLEKLDHNLLNDVIENPSAERIVMWIWDRLKNLQKLLKEEMDDPNLGKEIKALLVDTVAARQDRNISAVALRAPLKKLQFDKALRLYKLKLWETDGSTVTYSGH